MSRPVCKECETRVDASATLTASRVAGGSYRRPPRDYRSTICHDCAVRLVEGSEQPPGGHRLVGSQRWDRLSVVFALRRRAEHAIRCVRAEVAGVIKLHNATVYRASEW